MQKEVYRWLNQGKRRKKIITHLKQPMTAKQIAQTTGLREDCCSYVLQELSMYRMVHCLNPKATRSRLYWLTDKGKSYQKRILKSQGLPIYAYDFPVVDWQLYGWVCFNHRTAIIQVLTKALQPTAIRRQIKKNFPEMRISANNVADIIRLFLKKHIIRSVTVRKKIRSCYELTELGKKFQTLLYYVQTEPNT